MTHVFKHHRFASLESQYTTQLCEQQKRGVSIEALAAMASALQSALADMGPNENIPHASALDSLMRAVTHALKEPEERRYIREKLEIGSTLLEDGFRIAEQAERDAEGMLHEGNVVQLFAKAPA